MKISVNGEGQKAIVCIHGFRRTSEDFVQIVTNFPKSILIDLSEEDYGQPVSLMAKEIHTQINSLASNFICVGHYLGCFYVLSLAEQFPDVFNKLLLIEPVMKNESYLNYLQSSFDPIDQKKASNFETLPSGLNLKAKIVVYIHINVDVGDSFDKVMTFYPIVSKNTKSRLITHYKVGHMIHMKLAPVIIESIRQLK